MECYAILPDTSEPPIRPVERASTVAAGADYVMAAFEEHHLQLSSFAYGMARDREAAEDLVQESFLRLVRELQAGRTPDNVKAWLFRVCSNLAVSRGRRITVAQRFLRVARSHDEPAADVEILRREANETLLAALGDPPDRRQGGAADGGPGILRPRDRRVDRPERDRDADDDVPGPREAPDLPGPGGRGRRDPRTRSARARVRLTRLPAVAGRAAGTRRRAGRLRDLRRASGRLSRRSDD